MSQAGINNIGGGGGTGTVTSVTGTLPIVITGTPTVDPNVTINPSTYTTLGAASFNIAEFTVTDGAVSLIATPVTGITPQFQDDGVTTPGTTITGAANVFGILAGSAQVTDTINSNDSSSGTLEIEDRSWWTPYVVDASTTPGLRGTYTTIAAAMAAAVTDGASLTVQKTVYVRPGVYNETLTIPNGIILKGASNTFDVIGAVTQINGNVAVSTRCTLENLSFNATGVDTISVSGSSDLSIINCNITNAGSGGFQAINHSAGNTYISNTAILANVTVSGNNLIMYNCNCGNAGNTWTISGGAILAQWTALANTHVLSGTGAVDYDHCQFPSDSQISGTTSTVCRITNCSYKASDILITATGTFIVQDTYGLDSNCGGVYNGTPTIIGTPSVQGNILTSGLVTSSTYTTNTYDYYLGVNNAGAVAITLTTTALARDRTIIIKDQSGAAATNNITLTPQSGLIDGAASYLMNSNDQSVTLKFDGTNFYVI